MFNTWTTGCFIIYDEHINWTLEPQGVLEFMLTQELKGVSAYICMLNTRTTARVYRNIYWTLELQGITEYIMNTRTTGCIRIYVEH